MPDLIERTALSQFTLDGKPVREGQVVTIDRLQLGRLVRAGCVAESDEDNAAVPKADLPETQRGGFDFQAEIDEAAAKAAEQIAVHRQLVEDARTQADADIAEHRSRVTLAGEEADKAIAAHSARVESARNDADDAIVEHRKRLAEATREGGAGNGAGSDETPPAPAKGGKPKG